MKLEPHERDLVGAWKLVGNTLTADTTAKRIELLTKNFLVELGSDPSGWDVLYRDPSDGRLWELTYPQSESEGGGPPRLTHLSVNEAGKKYGADVLRR